MQRPLRVLAAAALLAAISVAVFAPHPVGAGTAAAPEVVDPQYDVKTSPGGQAVCNPTAGQCVSGSGVDILGGWIDNETASEVHFHVSGVGTSIQYQDTANFHFKVAGTDYVATTIIQNSVNGAAPQLGSGAATPGGVASAVTYDSTNRLIDMTVLRSAIGSPAIGGTVTDLFVDSFANPVGKVSDVLTDRAPDTGTATATYTFTMGDGAPPAGSGDSDGDLLNDTWEQSHFGNLNQTASGDPDGDGCNNACEQQAKTDPKKADTDGDGCSDGNEIKGGTDPTDPAKKPTDCAPSTTTSSTSGPPTSTTSGPPTTSTSSTTTSNEPDQGGDSGAASERLQEGFKEGVFGVGYLIIACAMAGLVILLALIGRGGRWGL